ncbi:adenylate isopentenyltransferase 5, chloroplastic-like [Chenopodium quinoa]|uniref:adenylate isopentenyltransferase 5, chloroplastic-like n=1 Tax=Chenopodium quinoa TaxID=63459 RepID=UPI000B7893A0|nr:adenylate isopentenyltransferase 5, chloroplastic-like [Chenopodium quinoa]
MRSLPMQMLKQAQPLLKMPTRLLRKEVINPWKHQRDKVVFVMGATGTGKSRLSIDLANAFQAEIINSDKIQVYKGLDVVTNKMTKEEQCGIPHHLLGIVGQHVDYTAKDFSLMATHAVESILHKDKLPIIVGGSNSYIESLVSNPKFGFNSKYDCCFLWVDVCAPVLYKYVSHRVEKMVQSGLVNEVREIFDPCNTDYTRGIRRAIGVPELDTYFRTEHYLDESSRAEQLHCSINEIKGNTCILANKQLQNINRLKYVKGWNINRIDATEVFRKCDKEVADETWMKTVTRPSIKVLTRFLKNNIDLESNYSTRVVTRSMIGNNNHMIVTN